ncbi:MAG: hypothetical protein K1W01_10640, partial [Muribaculaceae bacterium]
MKKITLALTLFLTVASVLSQATAQDYDDDLYYSPSRAAKEQKKQAQEIQRRRDEAVRQAASEQSSRRYYDDFESADKYSTSASRPLQMDVDAYNRRGAAETSAKNSPEQADFNYTRRIERYHNPDVVINSGDTALMDYYYSTPSQQDINVYVINSIEPASYAWNYNPWNSWGWNTWPYYSWGWPSYRPYWSISWGFDPWFDLSWGWGPSWG